MKMNKLLKLIGKVMIFSVSLILVLFFLLFFIAYSVEPWKTLCFSNLIKEDNSFSHDLIIFEEMKHKYPDFYKNETFISISSRAHDESMYTGSSPYCFFIRFWSYKEKEIEIKKIQILNEDLKYLDNNVSFCKKILPKKNVKNESAINESYDIVAYSTGYIFNLDNYYKDIQLKVSFRIDNENYDYVFTLKRIEKKGFFQARF